MFVVQKFGGRCVRDADGIKARAAAVAEAVRRGDQTVVIVSAMGEETDRLLGLASAVSSAPLGRELDMLLTAGERKAAALLSLALKDLGIPAEGLTGGEAGIVTGGGHTQARIVSVRPARIRAALDSGRVPVVGGAQGAAPDGTATFLGRGGSDTTAVALTAALGADLCEIVTDVPGVFTADPAVVPGARLLRRIDAGLLFEMCSAGCPKPTARAVGLARDQRVLLRVRSPFSREAGTRVDSELPGEEGPVAVVSSLRSASGTSAVSLIARRAGNGATAARSLAGMLDALEGNGITARPVSVSRCRLTCAVPAGEAEHAIVRLHEVYVEQAPVLGAAALGEAVRGGAVRSEALCGGKAADHV
jgi:aspartate kinase